MRKFLVDATSPEKSLDSEISLLDPAEAKGGTSFLEFIDNIRQLLINKINFILL
jgi:hypothetical protein